jgi:hypothetical protein
MRRRDSTEFRSSARLGRDSTDDVYAILVNYYKLVDVDDLRPTDHDNINDLRRADHDHINDLHPADHDNINDLHPTDHDDFDNLQHVDHDNDYSNP